MTARRLRSFHFLLPVDEQAAEVIEPRRCSLRTCGTIPLHVSGRGACRLFDIDLATARVACGLLAVPTTRMVITPAYPTPAPPPPGSSG